MISRANSVLAVATTWLVIVFGCYFFNVARPGLGTRWERLPPLPEQVNIVEWTRFGYVLATTEDARSYKVYPRQDEPWTLFDEATEEDYGEPCETVQSSRFSPPSPPGEPTSRSSADCFASAENRYYGEVILLENNEVWLWMHLYGGIGEALTYLFLVAAGALGVLLLAIGGVMKFRDA